MNGDSHMQSTVYITWQDDSYAQSDCYYIIYWIYEIHTSLTEEKIQ
jgi:hypothetical protein